MNIDAFVQSTRDQSQSVRAKSQRVDPSGMRCPPGADQGLTAKMGEVLKSVLPLPCLTFFSAVSIKTIRPELCTIVFSVNQCLIRTIDTDITGRQKFTTGRECNTYDFATIVVKNRGLRVGRETIQIDFLVLNSNIDVR